MSTTDLAITVNSAVLTSGQTGTTGLKVARDGIKDDTILEQIESTFSRDNVQVVPSGDSKPTAVTVKMDRVMLAKLVDSLRRTTVAQNAVVTSCIESMEDILKNENEIISLTRKDVAKVADMKHEIEEIQTENSIVASEGRLTLLPAAGTEFITHPDVNNMENIVNIINEEQGGNIGTELIQDVMEKTPTEVGLAPINDEIKDGNVVLDSMAPVRPVIQNNAMDKIIEEQLTVVDAFSSADIAVTPLGDLTPLKDICMCKEMVQPSPYSPPKLIVTKDNDGKVTDVAYEEISALTEEEWESLPLNKPLLEQDFSAAAYSDSTFSTIQQVYDINNWHEIPTTGTFANGARLFKLTTSGRVVDGYTARSILGTVGKLWNGFKNKTGASNANIVQMLGQGAALVGNLIGGSFGTTTSKIGNFIAQGAAAFATPAMMAPEPGKPSPMNQAKYMTLNAVPNLCRRAVAENNRKTVSSTVTAAAVDSYSRSFSSEVGAGASTYQFRNGGHRVRLVTRKGSRR